MKGYISLLKKELREQYRTHRLLIVIAIFTLFGIGTPLLLKFLPEILKLSGETIQIQVSAPTAVQSFTEFAGTIGQIGIVVAVLIGMGIVANELRHGTAVMTLSKPVSRAAFVSAKLTAISLTFLLALTVAASFCFFYTDLLIEDTDAIAFFQSNLLMGLFLVFCLAITVLFSCLFRNSLAAGGIAIAIVISQMMMSGVPVIGDYLPGKLLEWGTGIITGIGQSYWWALGVTIVLMVLAVYLGQYSLKKREI
jgi:ABC-2 type transport system permease protein